MEKITIYNNTDHKLKFKQRSNLFDREVIIHITSFEEDDYKTFTLDPDDFLIIRP